MAFKRQSSLVKELMNQGNGCRKRQYQSTCDLCSDSYAIMHIEPNRQQTDMRLLEAAANGNCILLYVHYTWGSRLYCEREKDYQSAGI
jgi:hypothetical protein